MSDSAERVTCPSCGKGYRWQAKLIDKHVPCKACGAEFIVPSAPGVGIALDPVTDNGTYDLDLDEPEAGSATHATPAKGGKCPSCNSPVREGAALCMNCGFNMAEGKKVQTDVAETPAEPDEQYERRLTRQQQRDAATAEDTYREYQWQEYKLPIILLCVGFAFVLINAFGLTPPVNTMYNNRGTLWPLTTTEAVIGYIVAFVLTLVLMIPLLLGGIFLMATFLGSAFGSLYTAVLKLMALTAFVVALDDMVDLLMDWATGGFGFIGWGIRLSVVLAAFYPICVKLFDMESHEIWIMFLLYVLGPIAIGFLAVMIAFSFI